KLQYHTRSVRTWCLHLKVKHSTTPTLAGCLLRCECGNESFSHRHCYECEIANFTVIMSPLTPQCIMCEKYPKTACGYMAHFEKHHKSSLKANGIYLLCLCGMKYSSVNDQKKHDK
ncbi:hypothetical protein PMAYCL1PPCAC_01491, partial [Pristionchus mayeri]